MVHYLTIIYITYVYRSIYVYMCMYVYIYIYMMHIYIYIYISILKSFDNVLNKKIVFKTIKNICPSLQKLLHYNKIKLT